MSTNTEKKSWFGERFPVSTFGYKVPKHANTFLFSLGGITMINMVILIVTGFILAQYYDPNPETANQSIRILETQVPLGSLIRGLHVWTAEFVTVSIILHLLRVMFYGSHKKPRELHWVFGVILFVLTIGLIFTGTILKWDQEAGEALAHAVALGGLLGPLGFYFSKTFAPDVSLLNKFFTLHVSVLPVILVAVIVIHLYLVKTLKISKLPYAEKKDTSHENHTFFHHFYKLIGYGFVVFGLLLLFAIFSPPELQSAPVNGVEATQPPWAFMGIFSMENFFGLAGLLWTAIIIVVLLFLVPWLDFGKTHMLKDRKPFVAITAIVVLVLIGLTVNAYTTKPKQHLGMEGMGGGAQIDNATVASILNGSKDLVAEIKDDVDAKKFSDAQQAVVQLDKSLAPVDILVGTSNEKMAKMMNTDDLKALMAGSNPDVAKVDAMLTNMSGAIDKAIAMYPAGTAAIDDANAIIKDLNTAISNKDVKAAQEQAEKLDSTLDPLKDTIKDKYPKIVQDLNTDGLGDVLKDASPDWNKASSIAAAMQKALDQASDIFTVDKLNQGLGIVNDLQTAVQNKDVTTAIAKGKDLDELLDPVKDTLKDKDASLVNTLNTDGLNEALSASQPDWAKAKETLTTMQQALTKAKSFYSRK